MACSRKILWILVIRIIFFICNVVMATPNTTPVSILCNNNKVQDGDPFLTSLFILLVDIVNDAPNEKNYETYMKQGEEQPAYGYAKCIPTVTPADCYTCLVSARGQIVDRCQVSVGAQLVLGDCRLRYEQYDF